MIRLAPGFPLSVSTSFFGHKVAASLRAKREKMVVEVVGGCLSFEIQSQL